MKSEHSIEPHLVPARNKRPAQRKALALLFVALTQTTCAARRTVRTLEEMPVQVSHPPRVHTRDGRVWVFETWTRSRDAIEGRATIDGESGPPRVVRVRAEDVVLVEVPLDASSGLGGTSTDTTALAVLAGVGIVAFIGIAIVVAAFAGGHVPLQLPRLPPLHCPTLSVRDGDRWSTIGYGFANAGALRFRAESEHRVPAFASTRSSLDLRVRNDEAELDTLDRVALRVVDGPLDTAVQPASDGSYVATREGHAPTRCAVDGAAVGCSELSAQDGAELALHGDVANPAARATITTSHPPIGARRVAVLIEARNTDALALARARMHAMHGARAGAWLASIERGDPEAIRWWTETERALTFSEVSVRTGAAARVLGTLPIVGSRASGALAFVVDVDDPSAPIEVSLALSRLGWVVDTVRVAAVERESLAYSELRPTVVSASELPGRSAHRMASGDARALLATGDELVLRFALPEQRQGASRALFVQARGYYHRALTTNGGGDLSAARAALSDPLGTLPSLVGSPP